MKKYVVGLVVDEFNYVVLVRKNRPDWQVGKLNGVGGHIEEGETPYEAMVRECTEECGLVLHNWLQLGTITDNTNYIVYYYVAETSDIRKAETKTDEEIEIWHRDFLDLDHLVPPTDVFYRLSRNPIFKEMNLVERGYE